MGYTGAMGMAESGISLDTMLGWHLQSNHYPPIDLVFVPICIEALDAILDEEPDRQIELPTGLNLTAAQIVEEVHLEPFLDVRASDREDAT